MDIRLPLPREAHQQAADLNVIFNQPIGSNDCEASDRWDHD